MTSARQRRRRDDGVLVFARLRSIGLVASLLVTCLRLVDPSRVPAQQSPPPSATQGPPPVQAIPASEVAERAEDLQRVLRRVESQLASSPTVQDIDHEINRRGRGLHLSALETDEVLSGASRLIDLREEERYWSAAVGSSARFQEQLTGRAATLERVTSSLDRLQAVWEATRTQLKTENELEPLAERIESALTAIAATKSRAQTELDQLVRLQARVAEQQSLASEEVDEIEVALARFRKQLFERSSRPFWQAPWRQKPEIPPGVPGFWRLASAHMQEFLRTGSLGLAGLIVLFLVVLVTAVRVRRKAPPWIEQGRISQADAQILNRPASLAIVLTLTPTLPSLLRSSVVVQVVVILLLLLATMRLVPMVIGSGFQPFLYTLLALCSVAMVRPWALPPFLERTVYAVSTLGAIGVIGWLIRRTRVKGLVFQGRGGRRLLLAIRGVLVLFGLCILLNLIGYLNLAWTLQDAALVIIVIGIVLYFAFRVAVTFIYMLLRTDRARSSATIRLREKEILKWARTFLAVVACLFWLATTLDILTLRVQALNMVSEALNSPINLGKASLSLRDVLTFILVLFAGFALSKVVRFFLLEDVFSRLGMERGLPDAIATTIYYLLIVGVFVLALASAGVELSRFNVLTGAFGLGIGFGLQTVVNNFASGLILKYERRINVRDTVELASVSGVVQKVGVRASIIATSDGAEAIVPNSVLVTNQVLNWTLSSPHRRAVLAVGVPYGTDPKRVIALLVEVASSHPEVLRDPAAEAFLLGFGDKALNLQLNFWVSTVGKFDQVRSEVAVAVSDALQKAGIEMQKK